MEINIGFMEALEHMEKAKAWKFLEKEINKVQQDAFMEGYEYAITVLQDAIGVQRRKQPDD